ncbi:DNA topoisomerase 2-beta-like [Diadema antillarum]|uniref:DNA topoisomerase 2-beta-like n=1 Tax=Diadema antillarum TaxID=105358 RepID=UPI003A8AFBF4
MASSGSSQIGSMTSQADILCWCSRQSDVEESLDEVPRDDEEKRANIRHILLRPDTYIGSIEAVKQAMWVIDNRNLVHRVISFVPGLYKICDDVLVASADHKRQYPSSNCIKINIDSENSVISVRISGRGIPISEHAREVTHTPRNVDVTCAGNESGNTVLPNVFSKKFTVLTACRYHRRAVEQSWIDNMSKKDNIRETTFDGDDDFVEITFSPDLEKFSIAQLDSDTVALLSRRAYDVAGCLDNVNVFLNEKELPISGFKAYVDFYVKSVQSEDSQPLKVVHEQVNPRWEVCLCMSEKGFQQVSFVNSITTTKGGRHVDHVADQIVTVLMERVKERIAEGVDIKPYQIKNHMFVFVNCWIENPTFDSRTRQNMVLPSANFAAECQLGEEFLEGALSCGIVESVVRWIQAHKENVTDQEQTTTSQKPLKLWGIPKFDDAREAGGENSSKCTLILAEGDSARAFARGGLGVAGRHLYGVYPIRYKLMNVRDASSRQVRDNVDICNIMAILGLEFEKMYDTPESLNSLRYGRVMIMANQDVEGAHFKGLLINFFHHNWPALLKQEFLEQFVTPVVKVFKGEQAFHFFTNSEEWKKHTPESRAWKVKNYKGLGTSTMKEAREYFNDIHRHKIPFKYEGPQDDEAIELAFSRRKCDERRSWMVDFMVERRKKREAGMEERSLYSKETGRISYKDFINKELVAYFLQDNERCIPAMADGLKPSQRKVLYTCFEKYDNEEVKVVELAAAVSEITSYRFGEQSLMSTIINLAQNFVGSNNLNLLQPIGQFGTRLRGGRDAASPRYIFTQLSSLARLLFPACDDNLLTYLHDDDNQRIEPENYVPIIPMVLVNGSEGIGTGWSTRICKYDVREVVDNIRRMIAGEEPVPMLPSYRKFKGTIEEVEPNRFLVTGVIEVVDSTTVVITELPIGTWTQIYREQVLERMLHCVSDFDELHVDGEVRFVVKMSQDELRKAEEADLHKVFRLQTTLSQTMVLFDTHGCIRRYDNAREILKEFFSLRMELYHKRKTHLEGLLRAESSRIGNQVRFIEERTEGKIRIENMSTEEAIQLLAQRGYDSDPVEARMGSQGNGASDSEETGDEGDGVSESGPASGPDFKYLLGMAMWSLTKEKKEELLRHRDKKEQELSDLKKKTAGMLWLEDLQALSRELDPFRSTENTRGSKHAKTVKKSKTRQIKTRDKTKT